MGPIWLAALGSDLLTYLPGDPLWCSRAQFSLRGMRNPVLKKNAQTQM